MPHFEMVDMFDKTSFLLQILSLPNYQLNKTSDGFKQCCHVQPTAKAQVFCLNLSRIQMRIRGNFQQLDFR